MSSSSSSPSYSYSTSEVPPEAETVTVTVHSKTSKYVGQEAKSVVPSLSSSSPQRPFPISVPPRTARSQIAFAGLSSYPVLSHLPFDLHSALKQFDERRRRRNGGGQSYHSILQKSIAYTNTPYPQFVCPPIHPSYADSAIGLSAIHSFVHHHHYYTTAFELNHSGPEATWFYLSDGVKEEMAAKEILLCHDNVPKRFFIPPKMRKRIVTANVATTPSHSEEDDEDEIDEKDTFSLSIAEFESYVDYLYPMSAKEMDDLRLYKIHQIRIKQEEIEKAKGNIQTAPTTNAMDNNSSSITSSSSSSPPLPPTSGDPPPRHDDGDLMTISSFLIEAEKDMKSSNSPSPPSPQFPTLVKPTTTSPNRSTTKPSPSSFSLSSSLASALERELTTYLDLVEYTLITQIHARSHSFFTSLYTMQSLHAEISVSIKEIKFLRERIHFLHSNLIEGAFDILKMKRKINNIRMLMKDIETIQSVRKSMDKLKLMMAGGDYTSSMELMEEIRRLRKAEMKDVKCLDWVDQRIEETWIGVKKAIFVEFPPVLYSSTIGIVNGMGGSNWSPLVSPLAYPLPSLSIAFGNDEDREKIQQFIMCLLHLGHSHWIDFVGLMKNAIVKELVKICGDRMECIVRKERELKEKHKDEKDSAKETDVQQYVASLSPSSFMDFIRHAVLPAVLHPIARVVAMRSLFCEVYGQFVDIRDCPSDSSSSTPSLPSSRISSKEVDSAIRTFNEIIVNGFEWVHESLSALFHHRQGQHTSYDLSSFAALSTFTIDFITFSHNVVSHQYEFSSLQDVLLDQISMHITSMHSHYVNELASGLEKETWNRVEIPREFQSLIDSGFTKRVTAWDKDRDMTTSNGLSARVFFVERVLPDRSSTFDKYPTVKSVLHLLHIISVYIDFSLHLPHSSVDIIHRLCELLQLFNSRSIQLVLGAGALHLAGLKTITTSHLALCAQCCCFVVSQMAVLSTTLSQRLPIQQRGCLQQFDRVARDFNEHQREIQHKLINIFGDIADQQWKKLFVKEVWNANKEAKTANSSSTSTNASSSSADPYDVDNSIDPSLKAFIVQLRAFFQSLQQLIVANEQREYLSLHISRTSLSSFQKCLTSSLQPPPPTSALSFKSSTPFHLDLSKSVLKVKLLNHIEYLILSMDSIGNKMDWDVCREIGKAVGVDADGWRAKREKERERAKEKEKERGKENDKVKEGLNGNLHKDSLSDQQGRIGNGVSTSEEKTRNGDKSHKDSNESVQ